jgi:hypothetical protein
MRNLTWYRTRQERRNGGGFFLFLRKAHGCVAELNEILLQTRRSGAERDPATSNVCARGPI